MWEISWLRLGSEQSLGMLPMVMPLLPMHITHHSQTTSVRRNCKVHYQKRKRYTLLFAWLQVPQRMARPLKALLSHHFCSWGSPRCEKRELSTGNL